jgi:hypothetical protein
MSCFVIGKTALLDFTSDLDAAPKLNGVSSAWHL